MLLSTPTRVPAPPVVPTRIPAGVSTPVSPGVSLSVPTVPPSVPSIPTERPYMYGLKQSVAAQSVQVQSVAGVKLLVSAGESVAFPSWGSTAVSGAAALRVAFPRAAAQSVTVLNTAVVRPTLPVVSSAVVSGAAAVRAAYPRTAGSTTTVAGSAAVKALYGRTAANTTSVSGSAALTATNILIYRDDFNGTTFDSGWTTNGWTLTGTGLVAASSSNNGWMGRLLPSPLTTVAVQASVTVATSQSLGGVGVIMMTSNPMQVVGSSQNIALVVQDNGFYDIRINDNDAYVEQQITISMPATPRIEYQGGTFKFFINGTQVYTYSPTTAPIIYGIGLYQRAASTTNRIDWIEARVP